MPAESHDDVYFDHAASAPLWDEVIEVISELSGRTFANPSGSHRAAREARRILEESRDRIAAFVGSRPSEVVWCSGGTEADNLAVGGVGLGGSVIVSAVEHPAVMEPAERRNARLLGVTADGLIDLAELGELLDDEVGLVSVMAVNNEIGTVQPLAALAELVRARSPRAVIHTDAVQAAPWCDLTEIWPHVDAMSLSAHKIGGPKGIGTLIVRDGVSLRPALVGGGQERGRRSGTQNVVGAAAMAAAADLTSTHRAEVVGRVSALRARLVDGLRERLDGVTETSDRRHKVAGNAHVCVAGVESEALLFLLDRDGIAASAASSCASGAQQSSSVLAAIGVPSDLASGAVRFTLGATTSEADIDRVLEVVPDAVRRLRSTGS